MMSDLGLNLGIPPARGNRAKNQSATKRRDLTEADVKAFWDLPEGGLESKASPLLKIRSTHHMLARLLAEGRKQVEISEATGYSPSYICSIQNDPAFKNLIEYYKGQVAEQFSSVHERLAAISMVASEEILERLATEPESFSNREILETLELAADRSGAGPQSRNVNVNLNVGFADRLSAARSRAQLSADPQTPALSGPDSEHRPPAVLDLRADQFEEKK